MTDYQELMGMYEQNPGITIVVCCIAAAFALISAIAQWKVFKKIGVAGWKAIIPVVNEYVLMKHCWSKGHAKRLIVFSILDLLFFVLSDIFGSFDNPTCQVLYMIFGALEIAAVIYCAYLTIRVCFRQSRAFGHGYGFGFGLLFMPFIFNLILGFGKDKFVGPAPVKKARVQAE